MTSLNGDTLVLRNGRSTSQVSIYNYPEHLNPFYEDDQHKRLRFWKLNKNNEGRRNSFSIGNLRDMMTFKSFRLKKKSSTLGINKTSESPPPLRREFETGYGTDHFNTFDKRSRYSDNGQNNQFDRGVGYRSSLQNMNPGQNRGFGLNRNDQYRRTVQHGDLSTQPRRYVYGGSVTPQPQRSQEHSKIGHNQIGSSRLSVNTNPFESDDDMEDYVNRSTTRAGSSLSISSKTPRKKRRAPAPPVPVHKVSNDLPNNNQISSHPNNELHIEENLDISALTAEIESFVKTTGKESSSVKIEEKPVNHNKTNGTVSNGVVVKEQTPLKIVEATETKTQTTKQEIKTLNSEPLKEINKSAQIKSRSEKETQQIKSNQSVVTASENSTQPSLVIKETITTVTLPPKEKQQERSTIKPSVTISNNTNGFHKEQSPIRVVNTVNTTSKKQEVGHMECIHIHVDNSRNEAPHFETNRMTSFGNNQNEAITSKTSFTLTSPPAVRKEVLSERTALNKVDETKLSNSPTQETVTKKPTISIKPEIKTKPTSPHLADIHKPRKNSFSHDVLSPIKPPRLPSEERELPKVEKQQQPFVAASTSIKIVETQQKQTPTESQAALRPSTSRALQDEFDALYRMRTTSNLEWKKSTLAPLEQHVPPEKRKSVKDIIESINRSQRLLKVGATVAEMETSATAQHHETPDNSEHNLRSLEEAQIEIKRMFGEIALAENAAASATSRSPQMAAEPNGQVSNDYKPENGEIFTKCRVTKEVYDYRESSPTTSNLDWNPLPKPKRSKNVTDN